MAYYLVLSGWEHKGVEAFRSRNNHSKSKFFQRRDQDQSILITNKIKVFFILALYLTLATITSLWHRLILTNQIELDLIDYTAFLLGFLYIISTYLLLSESVFHKRLLIGLILFYTISIAVLVWVLGTTTFDPTNIFVGLVEISIFIVEFVILIVFDYLIPFILIYTK